MGLFYLVCLEDLFRKIAPAILSVREQPAGRLFFQAHRFQEGYEIVPLSFIIWHGLAVEG
jgi:hypothetical protein